MQSCNKCRAAWPDGARFCPGCGSNECHTPKPDTIGDGALAAGTELAKYRIIELIGEGGMGRVYLAEHTQLGRRVALKVLRENYSTEVRPKARFYAEARAVNQIAHENIVQITDFVEELDFYVMELLRGESLRELLDRETVLLPARAVNISLQVASAMASVHDARIVHRDLKPDNVFLSETGQRKDFVKLLDFGVAKHVGESADRSMAETNSGFVIGTPKYMSPEQACGNRVDHRSDIYAFGVVLYEMVAGRLPLDADNFGRMVVLLTTTTPVAPRKVKGGAGALIPRALDDLVMRCLQIDPIHRPDDLREIVTELEAIARDLTIRSPGRSGVRWRWPLAAGAAAVGMLGVGLVLSPRAAPSGALVETIRPTTVQVVFSSTPPGALVQQRDSDEVLGITPVSLLLPRSWEPTSFTLSKTGYQPVEMHTTLDSDARLTTRLIATPAPDPVEAVPVPVPTRRRARPDVPTKRPKKLDERAIMDPFTD